MSWLEDLKMFKNQNIYNEINVLIEKNNSISFDSLLYDYETFEEPSLFDRLDDAETFKDYILREDLNTFFFNLALNHLNNLKLYAKKYLDNTKINNFFSCLTYTDDDEIANEFGFYIPRFLITRKEDIFLLKQSIKRYKIANLNNYPMILKTLTELNLLNTIDVYHHEWYDNYCDEYIRRFYFLNKD